MCENTGLKMALTTHSMTTPRYLPKRIENVCSHKNLNINVHSNIIHNSQNLKSKFSSADKWIDQMQHI